MRFRKHFGMAVCWNGLSTASYAGLTYGPMGPGPWAPRLGGPHILKIITRINKDKVKIKREKRKEKEEKIGKQE